IKCIDCCDLIFTVCIAVISSLRAPCEIALHRLFPAQTSYEDYSKLLSPGLITWTITYRPICGSEGQRGTLRTHWVPGGDQETGQLTERTDGRTNGRTNN